MTIWSKRSKMILWIGVLVAASLACQQLTGQNNNQTPAADEGEDSADSSGSPTPNLTLTAVFATPLSILNEILGETDTPDLFSEDSSAQKSTSTPIFNQTQIPISTPGPGLSTLIPVETVNPITLNFSSSAGLGDGSKRPGSSVLVTNQSSPPIIDGDPGDWQGILYSANRVVFGPGFYADANDLSANFKMGWDSSYLYLGVAVQDSKFVQTATGPELYLGDSLEILFDADIEGDFSDIRISDDDYQVGISPGNVPQDGQSEAYIWTPPFKVGPVNDIQVGVRIVPKGYLMEVAIPWSVFDVTPYSGQHFGFLLSISDNDSINHDAQQSLVSFAPSRFLFDPTTWHDLVLSAP